MRELLGLEGDRCIGLSMSDSKLRGYLVEQLQAVWGGGQEVLKELLHALGARLKLLGGVGDAAEVVLGGPLLCLDVCQQQQEAAGNVVMCSALGQSLYDGWGGGDGGGFTCCECPGAVLPGAGCGPLVEQMLQCQQPLHSWC